MTAGVALAVFLLFASVGVIILMALAMKNAELRGRYERLLLEHTRVVAEHAEQESRQSRVPVITDGEIIEAARGLLR